MFQDLHQRPPAQLVLFAGGTLAQLLGQYATANLAPQLHIGAHSSASLRSWRRSGLASPSSLPRKDAQLRATILDCRDSLPAPPFLNAVNRLGIRQSDAFR